VICSLTIRANVAPGAKPQAEAALRRLARAALELGQAARARGGDRPDPADERQADAAREVWHLARLLSREIRGVEEEP